MPKLPTAEQAARQLAHPGDNLSPSVITACAVSSALGTVFVALRIWSKRILYHNRFRLDVNDWLCLTAWALFIASETIFAVATRYGFGRHVVFVTNPRMLQILSLVAENLYAVEIALLKLSILSLYQHIFRQHTWFFRATWLVGFVAVSLGIWVILATNLQCIPIAATWDPTIVDATCINYGLSALLAYIVNIVIDLVILTMPIPCVLKLKLSVHRKWMLILTFATGGGACIVSIVQLKYITHLGSTSDPSWDNAPVGIVSSIEVMIGILAVSIATYRPLYQHFFGLKLSDTNRERVTDPYAKNLYTAQVSANSKFYSSMASQSGITATDQVELVRHMKQDGQWVRVNDDETS
ncbi:hypothetical protein F5B22DRAFT_620078 [Xylaria bambusicola]|uniref:uncharacterized protein n=1 Tax=Xylaria bambusicola TaxID=326684 RepID=UPI0020081496|nr:uncharacterized protein F5B22DRAFT_620078 [Xylaria bambusicola]KAI0508718.1 hypothetical protein F5B22DRAFT_620078 [Xylaria bambusicola]